MNALDLYKTLNTAVNNGTDLSRWHLFTKVDGEEHEITAALRIPHRNLGTKFILGTATEGQSIARGE